MKIIFLCFCFSVIQCFDIPDCPDRDKKYPNGTFIYEYSKWNWGGYKRIPICYCQNSTKESVDIKCQLFSNPISNLSKALTAVAKANLSVNSITLETMKWNQSEDIISNDFFQSFGIRGPKHFSSDCGWWSRSDSSIINPNAFSKLETLTLSGCMFDFKTLFQNLPNLGGLNLTKIIIPGDINRFPKDSFAGLKNLRNLSLSFEVGIEGRVYIFESGCFNDLENLERLEIKGTINHWFVGSVSENIIEELSHLKKLKYLSLEGLRLAEVDQNLDYLPRLSSLTDSMWGSDYWRFPGVDLPKFPQMKNLQELHIYKFEIEKLKADVFSMLGNLKTLGMQKNDLQELSSDAFSGLKFLEQLDLGNNKLTNVESGRFRDLKKLKRLYMDHNQLSNLDENAGEGLGNLVLFNLANNQLDGVPDNFFNHFQSLKDLSFAYNPGFTLTSYMLRPLRNIETLYLTKVSLTTLPSNAFDGLKRLQTLDLGENQIEKIDSDQFRDLENLQWLRMDENKLKNIEEKTFANNKNLTKLDLNENELFSLPVDFTLLLQSLKELDISKNPWKCDQRMTKMLNLLRSQQILLNPNDTVCSNDKFNISGCPSRFIKTGADNYKFKTDSYPYWKGGCYCEAGEQNELIIECFRIYSTWNQLVKSIEIVLESEIKISQINASRICFYEGKCDYFKWETTIHYKNGHMYYECSRKFEMSHMETLYKWTIFTPGFEKEITSISMDYCPYILPNPSLFDRLPNLRYLSLSNSRSSENVMNYTNVTFEGLSKLKNFSISWYIGPKLFIFKPNCFDTMKNIEGLHFAQGQTNISVFKELNSLKSLKNLTLFFSYANVNESFLKKNSNANWFPTSTEFPSEAFQIPQLEKLKIGRIYMPELRPNAFRKLKNLKSLRLDTVLYKMEPDSFAGLENLKYLDLSNNNFRVFPDKVFSHLSNLQLLDIRKSYRSEQVPTNIFEGLTKLRVLDLSENKLYGELGNSSFELLENLQVLYLQSNSISGLHNDSFKGLYNLQVLDIRFNSIPEVPEGIFDDLGELQYLFFRANWNWDLNKNTPIPKSVVEKLPSLKAIDPCVTCSYNWKTMSIKHN